MRGPVDRVVCAEASAESLAAKRRRGRWLQKASRSASSSLNRALGPAETLEPPGSGERCLYRRRAPEFTEVGAGLSRWPNALRALDALGVGGEVRSRAAASIRGCSWES